MGERYHEYKFQLFLSAELYAAVTKLQAEKGLGRSYGCLLALTEGLHSLGYLCEEDHQKYLKRYSEPLVEAKPPSKEELEKGAKQNQLEHLFQGVLSTGLEKLSPKARAYWIQKAKENPEVPNARLVLALGKGDG
jgi:hypothetical protein